MKKYILLFTCLTLVITAFSQENENKTNKDTLDIKIPGGEVIIYKDTGTQISISFPRSKNKIENASVWEGIFIGFTSMIFENNSFIPPQDYSFMRLNLARSRNFQINIWEERVNLKSNKLNIVSGIGIENNRFSWSENYVYVNANRFPGLQSDKPYIGIRDSSQRFIKSRLIVNSITLPIMLNFCANPYVPIKNQFNVSAGIIGKYHYRVRSKTSYRGNIFRENSTFKEDFGIIPLTLDATIRMRISRFNLFANYSLFDLFYKDKGPNTRTFSVGLALLSF